MFVTDPSKPYPVPRYRLRTFGPPALVGAEGDTLLGHHGHHRRRLALLAVLAAAGERGRSRDQLLLLFWPDATQSRARHSLDQLLYALRNSLGDSLFDGVNPVCLNPDVVSSDVAAFNAAIEGGDLDAAINEYRAPFLDGFYLSDAPEFELWADAERERLAASYAEALERLARDAATAQDHETAVRRWRTLVDSDPVSSKNAAGLIGALVNAGDHTAALQYAKRHEARVVRELGVGAGSAVVALVEEVRAKTRAEPSAALPSPLVTRESAPNAAPGDHLPLRRMARRRSTRLLIAALFAAGVAAAVWLRPTRRDNAAGATERTIAVLPFVNVSGTPQDAALVDGLTEELIGTLAKLGHVRVTARTSAFAFKNSDAGVQ
ncbi:MAG TPA: BTAD domain-containing putative transcriptional regulator, partial [Gemmatimonadaceae bacterium]|nr:BTAD domain-containing putative transcriptional regulator [Gemmatimonadaceae bacterium]